MSTMNLTGAIDAFTLHCRTKGLSPRTVKICSDGLAQLRAVMEDRDAAGSLPSANDVRTFLASLMDRELSETSIAIHARSVHTFCNFLVREGIVDASPMANISIPRVDRRFPDVLSEDHIARLVKAAAKGKGWTGTRNQAILLTFLDTGMRLGELVGLDLRGLDLSRSVICIRRGKGRRERQVPFGRSLFRVLRRWVEVRGIASGSQALYTSRSGRRIGARNVARIIERTAERAGLAGERVTPHTLRHSFATHYIKNGGDPFSLQRILGHSSITTTMVYVTMAGAGLREAHAKASPVDRLTCQ